MSLAWWAVAAGLAVPGYAFVGYPALLYLLSRLRGRRVSRARPAALPSVSVSLPVHNGEALIRGALEALLASDYPADRMQVLVISDASTDGTDRIVGEYRSRGVELHRLPERSGKTAAENAGKPLLRGEIVVNTDVSVRVHPAAIRLMVAAFADPGVGVAGAWEQSTRPHGTHAGESGYVGYEMWLRAVETQVAGMVGAAGCLYAIRAELHQGDFPVELSRDFASALIAREHGFRAVSVPEAICYVPVTAGLRREYRRKVRTFLRGMQTLVHKRALMNPFRYGLFAWMLVSHKLCRWLVPLALGLAAFGFGVAAVRDQAWTLVLAALGIALAVMAVAWVWPRGRPMPRLLAAPAYAVASNVAIVHAWLKMLHGDRNPVWEPTLRSESGPAPAGDSSRVRGR